MAMVKTPFDGEAKSNVKITRKEKQEKLKALKKVFDTDFKSSHDGLPLWIKARNGNHEADYVRSQWSPDINVKFGETTTACSFTPQHVKPKIEPVKNDFVRNELNEEEIEFVRYAMKGQRFKDDLVSLLGILVIAIYFYAMVLR